MTTVLLIMSALMSISPNQPVDFDTFYNVGSVEEQQIMDLNDIDSFEELDTYLYTVSSKTKYKDDGELIRDPQDHLDDNYPGYTWFQLSENTTKTVSNDKPINMQGSMFPHSDVQTAITNTGIASDYGGCGPIAMMGIMDYFARTLGYTEIMADPTLSVDRIALAEDVLNECSTIELPGGNTLMFPGPYENAFNSLMSDYGLTNVISASHDFSWIGGKKTNYLNTIKENVDQGLPVTLFTSFFTNHPGFEEHYTTIYGYEKWVGISDTTGEIKEMEYLVGRVNWENRDFDYYCDTDVLNDAGMGIITYDINYNSTYDIYASDFAEEFVNSAGGGQYFFHNIEEFVITTNGRMINTNRLRCSYIEDQYLVLSPNRAGAGVAYLDIFLPHSASKVTFDAAMWSSTEGSIFESFKIQYYDGGFVDHVEYDLEDFTTLRDSPNTYTLLFNKNVTRFRFYASHSSPSGSRNKGRIILDNMKFEYNI